MALRVCDCRSDAAGRSCSSDWTGCTRLRAAVAAAAAAFVWQLADAAAAAHPAAGSCWPGSPGQWAVTDMPCKGA